MEDSNKLIKGLTFIVSGAIVIYLSVAFRLIDLILILGVILLIYGVINLIFILLSLFYQGSLINSNVLSGILKPNSNSPSKGRSSSLGSNINKSELASNIKSSVLSSSGITPTKPKQVLHSSDRVNKKRSSLSFLGPTKDKESYDRYTNSLSSSRRVSPNYINSNSSSNNYRKDKSNSILGGLDKSNSPKSDSKLGSKSRDSSSKSGSILGSKSRDSSSKSGSILGSKSRSSGSKSNSKSVLIPRPEYNDSFADFDALNEYEESLSKKEINDDYEGFVDDVYDESSDDLNNQYDDLDEYDNEYNTINSNQPLTLRDFNFTPNYEKPMRVTRKPRRKSPDKIDIHNIPKRSVDGSRLILDDNTYLEFDQDSMVNQPPRRKTYNELAEEVIVPIHDFDDGDFIEPIHDDDYNYPQEDLGVYEDYSDDDLPYDKEFVIDDLDDEDDYIVPQVSSIPSPNKPLKVAEPIKPVTQESSIKVDPNNPESLPIPKLLNSYVICEKGILTSKDAFEEVATHAKSEILLEAPDIREMGEVFLLALTKVKSRVIIPELDTSDLSYTLLISSLVKSGIQVRTLPNVDSFNLIGDLSHALIISNDDSEDLEYGAVYDEEESVKEVKDLFEASWNIAKELNLSE